MPVYLRATRVVAARCVSFLDLGQASSFTYWAFEILSLNQVAIMVAARITEKPVKISMIVSDGEKLEKCCALS